MKIMTVEAIKISLLMTLLTCPIFSMFVVDQKYFFNQDHINLILISCLLPVLLCALIGEMAETVVLNFGLKTPSTKLKLSKNNVYQKRNELDTFYLDLILQIMLFASGPLACWLFWLWA